MKRVFRVMFISGLALYAGGLVYLVSTGLLMGLGWIAFGPPPPWSAIPLVGGLWLVLVGGFGYMIVHLAQ